MNRDHILRGIRERRELSRPPGRVTGAPDIENDENFGKPEAVITARGRRQPPFSITSATPCRRIRARSAISRSSSRCPRRRFAYGFGTEWFIRRGQGPGHHRDRPAVTGGPPHECRVRTGALAPVSPRVRMVDASWTHTGYAQQLVFGAGRVERRSGLLRTIGARRALFVTTEGRNASDDGARVRERLSATRWRRRSPRSTSHVPVPLVQTAVQQARRDGVDAIVSFGGGSCADHGQGGVLLHRAGGRVRPARRTPTGLCFPTSPITTTYSGAELTAVLRHDRSGTPGRRRARAVRPSRRSPRSTTRSSPCRRRHASAPRRA